VEKLDMLYEGKAKRVYRTEDKDLYIVEFKDDATAFNGLKKGSILNKGTVNNSISSVLFEYLSKKAITSHFVKKIDDRNMLVKAVEIVPLEVIVRNIAAGSMSKRLSIKEGTVLNTPVFEICYKNDELGDPLINDSHALALELCSPEEIVIIKDLTLRINEALKDFFKARELTLVDFKLEFGRYKNEIILADEISPDTCRLWDTNTREILDKDRFRKDLGKVEEGYLEILKRAMEG
jgi:phosphoribosylaminoimidazole-succinocarboxamide synthase